MISLWFLILLIPIKLISLLLATKGTLSGTIKPDRASLIMWSIPPLLSFAIAITHGSSFSALPLLLAGAGPLYILLLTFLSKHKPWPPRAIDYLSAPFCITAIILWIIVDNPNLAIIFAIIADIAAAVPTVIKAWTTPKTESLPFYILSGFGNAIGLATLKVWNIETAGFSIYLTILGLVMIMSIIHKRIVHLCKHFS